MKRKLIPLLLALSAFNFTYAQFSAGMHIGASNKSAVVGIHSQYQFNNKFTVGLNLTAHTDDTNPAFLESRFGYMIEGTGRFSIQPYVGYSYCLHSYNKDLQNSRFTEGVQFRYYLKQYVRIYTDFNIPASGFYVFSIGLTGML